MLTIVLTFSFLEAPGFEMGTHKLLIDKGPLAMPVLLVLLSACVEPKPKEIAEAAEAGPPSASLPTRAWRFYSSCFGVDAILSRFSSLAFLAWPLYITHMSLNEVLQKWARESGSGEVETPYKVLWVIPALQLLSALLAHNLIDKPARTHLASSILSRLSARRWYVFTLPGAATEEELGALQLLHDEGTLVFGALGPAVDDTDAKVEQCAVCFATPHRLGSAAAQLPRRAALIQASAPLGHVAGAQGYAPRGRATSPRGRATCDCVECFAKVSTTKVVGDIL